MSRLPAVVLEDAPEPALVPLFNDPTRYIMSREYWNGRIKTKALEIVYDPTGDFSPGARFEWEEFLGSGRDAYRPQIPALEEWETGTIIRDKRGRVFVLGETRCFVQQKAPQ